MSTIESCGYFYNCSVLNNRAAMYEYYCCINRRIVINILFFYYSDGAVKCLGATLEFYDSQLMYLLFIYYLL